MKRLKFLLLSFVLGCAMLAGAQTPEVFPLWPQGVKENNGIKVARTVDAICDNSFMTDSSQSSCISTGNIIK